jgi:MFS family permease
VTELGTQQWVERILGSSGAHPMLVLAMVTGLMALGRQFAGPVIHHLRPPGVLLGSAVIATIGIYAMSVASGGMVYVAAILFAVGVMYFWPTMIGFVGEYLPKTGALGMSLIGGVGMFATGIWQPVIGSWLDSARVAATASGLGTEAADLAAGQTTLDNLALFPLTLIVLFTILIFAMKRQGIAPQHRAVQLHERTGASNQ